MHVPGTRVHYGRRYGALFAERGRVSATTTPFPPPPVTDPFNAIPPLPSPPRATLFACLADESRAFFFCCTLALPEHRSAATRVQLNYLSRRSSVRFFPLSPFSSPGKISTTCPPVESVVVVASISSSTRRKWRTKNCSVKIGANVRGESDA